MQLVTEMKLEAFNNAQLIDRHICGIYTRTTVVDGLSILCKAESLVNEWLLSQVH